MHREEITAVTDLSSLLALRWAGGIWRVHEINLQESFDDEEGAYECGDQWMRRLLP